MSLRPVNELPREMPDCRYLCVQELHTAELYIEALSKLGSAGNTDQIQVLAGDHLASLLEPLKERLDIVIDWLEQDMRGDRHD